jgi:hypothetical protein
VGSERFGTEMVSTGGMAGLGVEVAAFGVGPTAETAHALDRLTRYEEYRQLYLGDQWITLPKPGDRRITLNYARAFVNKAASYLLGKPVGYEAFVIKAKGTPDESLTIASTASDDDGARQAERYLDVVNDFNQMAGLDQEAAISSGCLGDGAFTVRWDTEEKLPRVTAIDVRGLDARWRADDLRTLTWVRQRYWISPIELKDEQRSRLMEGKVGGGGNIRDFKSLPAHEEWTSKEWRLVVDGVEVDGGPNPYEEIPYIIFPNLRIPGEFWGESDLVDLATLQRELNERVSVFSRILQVAGNPVAVITGADEAETETLKLGPNELWTLPEGAEASVLDLLKAGGADAHFKYIELIYRAMHDISEMPRTSFGDSSGQSMARSGVALEIEMQPLLHKLARKQSILSGAFVRRAQLILKLARLHGEELPPVFLRCSWPPPLPQDRAALVQQEVALVTSGIHPPSLSMTLLNDPDPSNQLKKVLDENEQFAGAGLLPPVGRTRGAGTGSGFSPSSSSAGAPEVSLRSRGPQGLNGGN